MNFSSSRRMDGVQAPVIPHIGALIRANPGTIPLGQGVVHYGPPDSAMRWLDRFAADPMNHRYQHELGIPELRDRIGRRLATERGIDVGDYELVVTAGGNMAFLTALLAICDAGDEVILLRPYFFNQEMAVRMVGATPVIVDTDSNYQLDLNAVESAIGPSTRAVVTVSPNNPSGAVYEESDLRALNELCRRRGVYHISDEIYEYFVFDGAEHFSPASMEESAEHTISLYSFSKSYGFASWRVGYMLAPRALLGSIQKIQDTNIICAPVASQYVACGLLDEGSAWVEARLASIARVRRVALEELASLRGRVVVPPAKGAFYFLLEVLGETDSMQVTERLITEHRVAVVPGVAFGLDQGCHLRVAYGALDEATMREGLGRLVSGLERAR